MEKPEKQAILRQDTELTNRRNRQYCDKTQNVQTRDTGGSIETRHRMDKPETQSSKLKQNTEWTNQRHRQY
jgi:hypothetical protein